MYKFLTSFFVAVLFSWNVLAIAPSSDSLLHRLNLDDAFLNSPVCSVKRKGGALVLDYFTVKNDPTLRSGKVTFISKAYNEESDHGNVVAEVTSRFLPKGRTYLKTSTTAHNAIAEDLNNIHSVAGHPALAVNFSIDGILGDEFNDEEGVKALCNVISRSLRHNKILVFAAGNDAQFSGGQQNLNDYLFLRVLSKLSPQERKYVVIVGATVREKGREVLDARYSNIAGKFNNQFIFAPSNFSSYSPQSKRHKTMVGTSFAAPVITGLLTRALLANPHLTREEAIQLLFQTADKRNLVSTGTPNLDRALYGHGTVNARLYLNAAHTLSRSRAQGKSPQRALAQFLKVQGSNVFRDFKKKLRDRLDVMNLLYAYENENDADFKLYKKHIELLTKTVPLSILKRYRSSLLTLDDFGHCSEIFKAHKSSDHDFKVFALSKFPLSSLTKNGSSLLTYAIAEKRTDLANDLLKKKFNIHFRGGAQAPLPIHAAAVSGSRTYVQFLLQRGASVHHLTLLWASNLLVDPLFLTVAGAQTYPETKERLKILDILYHQGANFHQKIEGISLADLTEQLLGQKSPLTQRVQYYVKNSGLIKRKPLAILPHTQKQVRLQRSNVKLKGPHKQRVQRGKKDGIQARKKSIRQKRSPIKKLGTQKHRASSDRKRTRRKS